MDREETVKICKRLYLENSNLTTNEVDNIIISYCVEKGKKYADIQLLLWALYKSSIHLNMFLLDALEYYERKYTIVKLKSKLNSDLSRNLILIY